MGRGEAIEHFAGAQWSAARAASNDAPTIPSLPPTTPSVP